MQPATPPMNSLPNLPSACVYAVKLLAIDPNDPTRIAGRLEHVISGRRHDFADGPALLACLAREQALLATLPLNARARSTAPRATP